MTAAERYDVGLIFDPARLKLAREAAGLRKAEVAASIGVSAAAIGQFESGQAKPSQTTLDKLAELLGFPVPFFAFTGNADDAPDVDKAFFRSLRSTRQADRLRAIAHAGLVWAVVEQISQRARLPELDLPTGLAVDPDATALAIEEKAAIARRHFGLDDSPVPHVVRLLERAGVIVTRYLAGSEAIDAFSCRFGDRPVVVLTDNKGFQDRSRFDAAHELGHLVMHPVAEPGNKTFERQAHAFAAGFLMPRSAIFDELPSGTVDWMQMVALKRKWKVSIAALLYRARTLGKLNEAAYEAAMKTVSRKGWRTREPGDLGPPEAPTLLSAAMSRLAESGYTPERLAADAHLPLERVHTILAASEADLPAIEI
jgi:Zn-dependent peptidase ImmA (M78 family)/transcriptional regulator with XRE-family HTH domain